MRPTLILFGAVLLAQEWPQFRGPNGSGVSDSTGLPVSLSNNAAWKISVPFGQSSPVIGGDCVFLTASEGAHLVTLCVDRGNGRIRWRRETPRDHNQPIFKANDPASPTPATDGVNVYAFFPDLGLISYGPDGNERWRHKLGPFDNFYGMSAGPVFAGGKVILICDQRRDSFLLALDSKDGRVAWKAARPGADMSWTVPVIYRPAGGDEQVIVHGSRLVEAYALKTGDRLWWAPRSGELPQGVPLIDRDTIYVNSKGYDQPWLPAFASVLEKYDIDRDSRLSGEEFQSDPAAEHFGYVDADHDGRLTAKEWDIARASGVGEYGLVARRLGRRGSLPESTVRWTLKRNLPYVPSPLLYRGVIYLVKEGGIITSLDAATGSIHKQGRAPDAPGEYYASPVAADGKIYLLSEAGKATVLKAGPQWEVLSVNDLGEECTATPAMSDGRIFVRTRSALRMY